MTLLSSHHIKAVAPQGYCVGAVADELRIVSRGNDK